MFKNRKFRFSAFITLHAVAAAMLCYAMSYWQYTRYVEKKAYFATLAERQALGVQPLDVNTSDWESRLQTTVTASGSFDFEHLMVLRNRSQGNISGVKEIVPLKLEGSDRAILVDRGFLPYTIYSGQEPGEFRPEERVTVEGFLRPSHQRAFFLSPPERGAKPGEWKELWIQLEIEAMAAQMPYPLLPVYIEQTNGHGAYPSFSPREEARPARHLNYTIQWASFGTFALIFGAFLQSRPARLSQPKGPTEPEKDAAAEA